MFPGEHKLAACALDFFLYSVTYNGPLNKKVIEKIVCHLYLQNNVCLCFMDTRFVMCKFIMYFILVCFCLNYCILV